MADLAAARLDVVREHMDSENRHDYEATMRTFAHPRYELMALGQVHDGDAEVRRYFAETRTAFPDQRNRPIALHAAEDAVIAEFVLAGTHLGSLRGLPPTGRAFEAQMTAIFLFEKDGTGIICERVYFDAATMLRQLGLASDPLSLRGRIETALAHPITIGSAIVRSFTRR